MADFIQKFNNILGQTSQVIGVVDQAGDLLGVPGIGSAITDGIFGRSAPRGQFNITAMTSAINRYNGLLKSNLFLARITPPTTLDPSLSRDLIIFCDNANLPNVRMATDDIIRNGYGAEEKIAYKPLFGEIQLGFLVDGEGNAHKFFQDWINSQVSFDLRKGYGATDEYGKSPYEVNYKRNYQGAIQLCTYNEKQDNILEIEAFEAFPTSIDDVQLNWGDTDQLMRLSIRFNYTYYVSKTSAPTSAEGIFGATSFFGMLQKGASIVQTISTLKKPQSIGDVSNVINNASIIKNGILGRR